MHDHKNPKVDRNFNDDSNTTITKTSDKKENITSISNLRTRYRFKKLVDKLEQAEIIQKANHQSKNGVTIAIDKDC